MTKKIDYNHNLLDTKIEQLHFLNTTKLCNHTKFVENQHEIHRDDTKLALDDLHYDMHIMHVGSAKVLQDI